MKARVLTNIIALLSMAAGVMAQTYSFTIYDGKKYSTKERNAFRVLAHQGALSSVSIEGGTTYTTPDGTELVSTISNDTIFKVPTSVTPDNDMTVELTSNTKSWVLTHAPALANVSKITLHFQVAVNEQNFPDQNFRKWVLAQEYGSDSLLTKAEIAEVTEIDVSIKNIASLKGIEYFTALTKLICHTNKLTTLDVSKNTALINLYCTYNKLTSLDVTQNTALKMLWCFDNQIKGTGMVTLVNSLPQTTGELAVYNVWGTTEGNRITTLQVKTAKDKGWKVVQNGDGGGDYPGVAPGIAINATNFPDANFRSYVSNNCDGDNDGYLSDEEATEESRILLNYEGKIADLTGIEYFTSLAYLDCSGHQLTSLDVSKNTELEALWCSNNQLTTLDVSHNGQLSEIQCYGNNISGSGMESFVNSLLQRSNGVLIVVNKDGDNNQMTVKQMEAAKAKGWQVVMNDGSEYPGIPGLAIEEDNFPDDRFRLWLLAQDYGADGFLTDAEIAEVYSIDVSSKGITSLQGIEYFTALTSLDCYENQLTELDLSKNTNLEMLRCHSNKLKGLDVTKNTALIDLHCYNNQLKALDLSKNTALTHIECDANQLTELNLSQNKALTFLSCADNQLTSLVLSNEMPLTTIYCFKNKIQGTSMTALVNSLPQTTNGVLYVYKEETVTGNKMTTGQVATAKAKGWTPKKHNGTDYLGEAGGDANGDGELDETDLEIVRNLVLGITPSGDYYEAGADVNGDGTVDIVDVTLLIEMLK